MANHGVFTVGADLDEAFRRISDLEIACADFLAARAQAPLPVRADAPWDQAWVTPLALADGTGAFLSAAPFTLAWSASGRPLKALLDDLAQLSGPRVRCVSAVPGRRPASDVVLVRGRGAVVSGADATALAMVVEKAARAALGAPGLGGARPFPAWEAALMRWVYKNSYSKQAPKRA
jgi:hypothetical protein